MTNDPAAFRQEVLLSFLRALWDMATPELRGVAVRLSYPMIEARFIYEAVGDDEQEITSLVERSVYADFLPPVSGRFTAVASPPGVERNLEPFEEWVYLRREAAPSQDRPRPTGWRRWVKRDRPRSAPAPQRETIPPPISPELRRTKLPSQIAGRTTTEVGFFGVDHERLAAWLRSELGESCTVSSPGWTSVADAGAALGGPGPHHRWACIKLGDWSLVLTDGPLGTDVGGLPIHVAEVFSCRAIRAFCVDDDGPGYPGRILVVHGPDGEPPLNVERSIAAANDGGRWVFETSGTPYDFENLAAYQERLKKRRFTSEMLHDYLRHLDVPVDTEPDWSSTILLELPT